MGDDLRMGAAEFKNSNYSVMQSDGNGFGGDVVSDSLD